MLWAWRNGNIFKEETVRDIVVIFVVVAFLLQLRDGLAVSAHLPAASTRPGREIRISRIQRKARAGAAMAARLRHRRGGIALGQRRDGPRVRQRREVWAARVRALRGAVEVGIGSLRVRRSFGRGEVSRLPDGLWRSLWGDTVVEANVFEVADVRHDAAVVAV
jgi:hypothetical protein